MVEDAGFVLADEIARARGKKIVEESVYARKRLDAPQGVMLVALSPDQNVKDEIRESLRPGMKPEQLKKFRNRASVALWLRFGEARLFLTDEIEDNQYDVISALWRARVGSVRAPTMGEAVQA